MLDKSTFDTGVYKIHFETEAYFKNKNIETFYPYVEVNYKLFTFSILILLLNVYLSRE